MCGIFGVIPYSKRKWTARESRMAGKFFNYQASLSTSRGSDAAGLAVIRKNQKTVIFKDTVPASTLIFDKDWWEITRNLKSDTKALLGHTRLATHGANVKYNAHPFKFTDVKYGELIGTHNGIIFNQKYFNGLLENDSACLFWALHKASDEEMPGILQEVNGGFALAMHRNNKLILTRNPYNPLVVASCQDIRSLVYASEAGILYKAAKWAGMDITPVKQLMANRIYVIDLDTYEESTADFSSTAVDFDIECLMGVS